MLRPLTAYEEIEIRMILLRARLAAIYAAGLSYRE